MTETNILARLRDSFRLYPVAGRWSLIEAQPERVRLSNHLMRDIGFN